MKVIPIIGNDNFFLYRFLVSSRFRVARHITVIVALLVIACNLVLFSCQGYIEMLGKVDLSSYLQYVSALWFHFLFQFALSGTPLLAQTKIFDIYSFPLNRFNRSFYLSSYTGVYCIRYLFSSNIYVGYSKVAFVMDYLSSFPLTLLSIMGGGMTVLLRLWILENQRVMQLEKIRLQSEIEHLKEQISPSMLFRVLHYSGEQALVNPGKGFENVNETEPDTPVSVV